MLWCWWWWVKKNGGGGPPLSPPVVCSRCGGLSTVPRNVYCAAHFFPFSAYKKNGCSVLHALADLHYAPTLAAPQYKSGLRRIAAHRLRAVHCYWIIQELAERKRQREWGVCTLSPGETGAKEEASLDEWVTAAKKSSETPAEHKRKEARAGEPLLFAPLPLRIL